jgi:hypothetical protein
VEESFSPRRIGFALVGLDTGAKNDAAGVAVDLHEDALEAAREHGDRFVERNATTDEELRALEHLFGSAEAVASG